MNISDDFFFISIIFFFNTGMSVLGPKLGQITFQNWVARVAVATEGIWGLRQRGEGICGLAHRTFDANHTFLTQIIIL